MIQASPVLPQYAFGNAVWSLCPGYLYFSTGGIVICSLICTFTHSLKHMGLESSSFSLYKYPMPAFFSLTNEEGLLQQETNRLKAMMGE